MKPLSSNNCEDGSSCGGGDREYDEDSRYLDPEVYGYDYGAQEIVS